ncbi:MAG TPA: fructosamine kinase family protein [Solirubrobacteraceae bacterium]|nr:fructosamine kinase family protein [Solirubrobacteraceae bacterium]
MSLDAELGAAAGSPVAASRRIAGGSINEAYAVDFADGRRAFVKTRPGAPAGEYAAEAAALAWLGEPGAVRVPAVIACSERFLALEWVEPGRLDAAGEEELGRGLAGLHAAGAPAFGRAAGDAPARDGAVPPAGDLGIGPLTLDATPADAWPGFYAERLVRPLIAPARDRGALSARGAEAVGRTCDRIAGLAGPGEPPARLHGDLWSGNVHAAADGRAWLVDPVAYGGHREVDLAMLQLFGGPSRRLLAAYGEAAPLADGHEQRVELWQLFPLMVHAVLFGGGYGGSAEAVARRYVG